MNRLNRIKEILVIQGKIQTWLADQLGKTRTIVSNYVNSNTQSSIETLRDMARILDVDIRELLVPAKT